MDPKIYIDRIVLPAYHRYKDDIHDESLLYSVVVLLYHTVDHVAHSDGATSSAVAAKFENEFPDFLIIQALANAQKHAEYSICRKNPHIGLKASDISGSVVTFCGESITFGGEKVTFGQPTVELPNGNIVEISSLVNNFIDHLIKTRV